MRFPEVAAVAVVLILLAMVPALRWGWAASWLWATSPVWIAGLLVVAITFAFIALIARADLIFLEDGE